jgi:hypothetical protein
MKKRNETNYLKTPKLCINCKSAINYKHRMNKYCSRKCSAIHTQLSGGHKQYSDIDKQNHSHIMKTYFNKSVKFRIRRLEKEKLKLEKRKCKYCDNNPIGLKQICEECKFKYYSVYRPLCEFKFTLSDYPEKFNFDELKKLGMYSPVNKNNNLSGISRDHLYSVNDGFKNNIDPNIIKHPANCQLVVHKKNQYKYDKSSISLDELKNRIDKWENVKVVDELKSNGGGG